MCRIGLFRLFSIVAKIARHTESDGSSAGHVDAKQRGQLVSIQDHVQNLNLQPLGHPTIQSVCVAKIGHSAAAEILSIIWCATQSAGPVMVYHDPSNGVRVASVHFNSFVTALLMEEQSPQTSFSHLALGWANAKASAATSRKVAVAPKSATIRISGSCPCEDRVICTEHAGQLQNSMVNPRCFSVTH